MFSRLFFGPLFRAAVQEDVTKRISVAMHPRDLRPDPLPFGNSVTR